MDIAIQTVAFTQGSNPGGVEAVADLYRGVYSMADRYMVFARNALLESPSALPCLMAGCRKALGLRDREALVQVGAVPRSGLPVRGR